MQHIGNHNRLTGHLKTGGFIHQALCGRWVSEIEIATYLRTTKGAIARGVDCPECLRIIKEEQKR